MTRGVLGGRGVWGKGFPSRIGGIPAGALGLPEAAKPGDRARFIPEDAIGAVDGVVYFANAHTIGIRAQDALYRFLRGFGKPALAAHHLFAEDADPAQAQRAWESWLSRALA